LRAAGFTILRFDDEEVLSKMSWVMEQIEYTIEQLEKSKNIHPPTAPPAGDM
jgi:very-short-patch-repair endonuclease